MRRAPSAAPLLPFILLGCAGGHPPPAPPPAPAPRDVTISIAGTNDLHGAIDRLPILAGYIANLRSSRAADGGGVVLVDAGDMFQGTMESNLNEGAAIIAAYNAIGYDAAAVGNHEFDFGPAGPAATPGPGDDPRGALKQRAREAKFPILDANLADARTGTRVDWPEMRASTTVERAGVEVGIIGVTTELTPSTTASANFVGLGIIPLPEAIVAEAKALRAAGAKVVVVAAHAGGRCTDLQHPDDLSSCDQDEEIFKVARALPAGLVDVIVAGHIHLGIAQRVNGIAIIESFGSGRSFGRVDLTVGAGGGVEAKIFPTQNLCPLGDEGKPVPIEQCKPGPYEGKPVVADATVQAIVARAQAEAEKLREEKLGVTIGAAFNRGYGEESPVGNLVVDLMLQALPEADVATTNGGGLRAELPAGPLTYGELYRTLPFDNKLATARLTGAQVRKVVAANLSTRSSVLVWGGMTVEAACKGSALVITMRDRKGKPIDDARVLTVATSDFLLTGGEGGFGALELAADARLLSDRVVRDVVAEALRKSVKKELWPKDYYDAKNPRLKLPGARPITCAP